MLMEEQVGLSSLSIDAQHWGAVQFGAKTYRFILHPAVKETDHYRLSVSCPVAAVKWSNTVALSREVLFHYLDHHHQQELSYKFLPSKTNSSAYPPPSLSSDVLGTSVPEEDSNLGLKFGNKWFILLKGEYTDVDRFLEQLIQENKKKEKKFQQIEAQLQKIVLQVETTTKMMQQELERKYKCLLDDTNQFKLESKKSLEIKSAEGAVNLEEIKGDVLTKNTAMLKMVNDKINALEKKITDSETVQMRNLDTRLNEKKVWMRVSHNAGFAIGAFIPWAISDYVPESHFAHVKDKITIKKQGLYQICVSYEFSSSSHSTGYSMDILVSGIVVARCYHGDNTGLHKGAELNHIQYLKVNDHVQCQYCSNYTGNPDNDHLANRLTILCLEYN